MSSSATSPPAAEAKRCVLCDGGSKDGILSALLVSHRAAASASMCLQCVFVCLNNPSLCCHKCFHVFQECFLVLPRVFPCAFDVFPRVSIMPTCVATSVSMCPKSVFMCLKVCPFVSCVLPCAFKVAHVSQSEPMCVVHASLSCTGVSLSQLLHLASGLLATALHLPVL